MNEVERNIEVIRGTIGGVLTYTPIEEASFQTVTIDGEDYLLTGDQIDTRIDCSRTPVEATTESGETIRAFIQTGGRIHRENGKAYVIHGFITTQRTTPAPRNHWAEKASVAAESYGLPTASSIWDD